VREGVRKGETRRHSERECVRERARGGPTMCERARETCAAPDSTSGSLDTDASNSSGERVDCLGVSGLATERERERYS
jgi:hypothetical protein